jgi:hypothetical protein
MSTAQNVTIMRLLAVPAVTDIVGSDIAGDLGTASSANIAVSQISDVPWESLARSSGTWQARVSVSLRVANVNTNSGRSASDILDDLSKAVVGALNRFKGTVIGHRCSFQKAGSDQTRWGDDGSVLEQVMDWIVVYSAEPG